MAGLEPAADPRVSVVIVAARRPDRLERSLQALAAGLARATVPAETVLVLNGADEGVRALAAATPGPHVVDVPVSLGFADGANAGVAAARGELVLILHDDAEPQENWLDPLVACLDGRPGVAAVVGTVLYPDGTPQLAGAWLWSDGTTSPSWGDGPPALPEEPFAVDYGGSASLLVRRAAWQAVGGTDPEMHPAYYVDVTLSLRLRAKGWSVFCEPRSRIVHHKGSSSSGRAQRIATARNRERLLAHWPGAVAEQAPPGDVAGARERAAARAATPAPALPPAPPPDRTPLPLERLLAGAAREVAFRTAVAQALEAELDALEARVAVLDDTAIRSHEAAVEAVRAHETVFAELQALRARLGDQ